MIKTKLNIDHDLEYKKLDYLINKNLKNNKLKNIGIFIHGKPGVGKTTFLKEICQKLLNEKVEIQGYKVPKYKLMFFNSNDWIRDIQKSWIKELEFSTATKIDTSANVLLIDDFGSEFTHNSTLPYILNLFESRFEFIKKQEKNTITIITSNYSIEQLKNKYSKVIQDSMTIERLFSRIQGIINLTIEFEGVDKRHSNKIENKTFEYVDL